MVPDLRSVPDETKWRIATEYAACLIGAYEQVFAPVVAGRYPELEEEIWIRMAPVSAEIARSLRFPLETARDLAESLRLVNSLVSGPDYKDEIIDVGKDGAVVIIRVCPVLAGDRCPSVRGDGTFHRCMAFTLASQKTMNPKYTSRFVRAMCMGDRQCEIKIEREKEPEKKPG